MSVPAVEVAQHHQHQFDIVVNNHPVHADGPDSTGLQIKEDAIKQGVQIQLDFQLSEKIGEHGTKIIGDNDAVTLHEGAVFVAVAPDDNS